MKRYKKLIICIIMALFTVGAFYSANYVITNEMALETMQELTEDDIDINIDVNNHKFYINFIKLYINYESLYGVNSSIVFLALAYFYYKVSNKTINKRLKIVSSIGGLIYAFFMVFGNSFLYLNSWDLIFESHFQILVSIINYIGYFFIFKYILIFIIDFIYDVCNKKETQISNKENKKHGKIKKVLWNIKKIEIRHPVLFYTILFIICWLPYIIIFFPGTLNMDSLSEIEQFLGEESWSTHHPILPTVVFGIFMKIAISIFSNDNMGIFLNNIFQIILSAILLSYSINYIFNLTKSKKIKYIIFIFFAFFPIWPINFYTEVKDTYFSLSVFLYVIMSMKFINQNGKMKKREWIIYFISMILVYLFRNNGVFVLLISLPFFIVAVRRSGKVKIAFCTIMAVIVCMVFNKVMIMVNDITEGSIRETLSIPLQQTARYVTEYELTEEEENVISKLIDIDTIKENYDPETVDFVKQYYKSTATNEDLKEYIIIWFKMFLKHPAIYFEATMNSTYGYFYPNRTEFKDGVAYFIIAAPDIINVSGFELGFSDGTESLRIGIETMIYTIRDIPIIGLLLSCGFYTWIIIAITLILIYFKRMKAISVLIPLYVIILVCVASPVNALVRYVEPIMLSIPFLISWMLYNIKFKTNNKTNNLLMKEEK